MKVLGEGPNYETWAHKCICSYCNSLLEIHAPDLTYTFRVDGSVWTETYRTYYYYVRCPICQDKVLIDKSNVPRHVANKIPKWSS